MTESYYYRSPSALGLPILKLFVQNPSGECRWTIYIMERRHDNWGFNLSSVLKYLWRLGEKPGETQGDLKKAIQYLQYELESPRRPLSADIRETIEKAIEMCEDLLE